jgi:hypothetical protein
MLTPERKVKDKVKKVLKELGAYYAMPATGGYGSSGVPDFLVCYRGRFFGLECKANGGKPTALQEKNLEDIRKNDGVAFVVHEHNIGNLRELLIVFVEGIK